MAEIRRKAGSAPTAGVGETRSAVTGVLAGIVDRERARYDRTVRGLLYANWAGAAGFSGRNNQIARFEVTVGSAGKVLGIRLTHSSGDRFLDESAERAIRKADPFPPPPPGYSKLAIRFDPRERL